MSKPEALVLDLGGVLIEVDYRRAFAAWAAAAGQPASRIAARFARDEAYCAHERGEMDDRAYFAHLRGRLGIEIADEAFLAGWNAILGEPMPGIEPVICRLAAEFPLYVFSNTNPAHLADLKPRYGALLGRFRKIITSCDLGSRKPEREAFRRMAAAVGVAPSRLAFFDDLEENVAGARRAGIAAFRVSRPGEILAISESLQAASRAG